MAQRAEPTTLETALVLLVNVFQTYAGKEGKKDTLTKNEAKTLLQTELPGMIKAGKNSDDIDKLLKALDRDGDSEIDFKEFSTFVICLLCAAQGVCCTKK